MARETGSVPENETMSRRDFLKAAAVGSGLLAMERGAEAQGEKLIDNRIERLMLEADDTKIDYPEKPKKISSEVESLILAIQRYQDIYLAGMSPSRGLLDGGHQIANRIASSQEFHESQRNLWIELKKIDKSLPEFSEDNFYRTLFLQAPKLLAEYGIYARPSALAISRNESNKQVAFERFEVLMIFLEVDRVEHDQTQQSDVSVSRDIVYIKDLLTINGRQVSNKDFVRPAENAFRNVIIFERAVNAQFDDILKNLGQVEGQIKQFPKGRLAEMQEGELKKTNDWTKAAELAIVKIIERFKPKPTYQSFKSEILIHETRHRIDREEGDLARVWGHKLTSDPNEYDRRVDNRRAHDEINPRIAQLRFGPNRAFTLLNLISSSREIPGILPADKIPSTWIVINLVNIIAENPEKYGIETKEGDVSRRNQILSQLDVLLDKPEVLEGLCEKILAIHKQNISEDLSSLRVSNDAPEPKSILKPALKIGIPAIVLGGGAALAYKKFHERKQEQKSRQQVRQEERKKEKKKSKK